MRANTREPHDGHTLKFHHVAGSVRFFALARPAAKAEDAIVLLGEKKRIFLLCR
jgi:hypothetical protein